MHVCLVLGAGASLANAIHFRPERNHASHPPLDATFFEKILARDALTPPLRSYLRSLLGSEPTPVRLRALKMEEFFKDVFYDFQVTRSTASRLAYVDLVNVYTRVLRETTNWLCDDARRGAPIGKLIAATADAADQVDIITFNHDLVIENEIFKRVRLRGRWCIEEGYGHMNDSLTLLRSGTGTDFPGHSDDCDHRRALRVLKLHGSLNWVVRMQGANPSANQLLGQSANREVLLSRRRQIVGRLRWTRRGRGGGRGRSSWLTWPLIIPPIYAKQALIQAVDPAWADARRAIASCDRLVFFGYSLPSADIEAEKLFQRGIAANSGLRSIDVINRDPESSARFACLLTKKALSWYPSCELYLLTDAVTR